MDNEVRKPKRKKKSLVTILMFVVGIALIVFAAYNLFHIFMDYHNSDALYEDLNEDYVSTPSEKPGDTEMQEIQEIPWQDMVSVDLEQVQQQNPDVIGWIYFENEDISYPILYSGDDEKYLRTTLDGSSATAGSIFMEGQNTKDFNDSHTIIYGHNMKNLSMFGKLKYYKQDGYYEEHPYFQIITNNVKYRYQIFAYSDVDPASDVFTVPYSESQSFQEFIDQLYRDSYKDTGVIAANVNKILTLSTCSSDDKRFVVHAVRVAEEAD